MRDDIGMLWENYLGLNFRGKKKEVGLPKAGRRRIQMRLTKRSTRTILLSLCCRLARIAWLFGRGAVKQVLPSRSNSDGRVTPW